MTTVELKEKIDLTEKERRIFDVLLDAIRESNHESRLLGKDSDNIDIAIDNMTGREFLECLKKYLSSKGEDVNVHIIKSNPDNFKNLETGKMRLYNQWIDFVQLRKEEDYDVNSRIPQKVESCTPKEYAYRRDLTINSLFYNIHTGLVEDLTGRGINDLKSGRIVTPLPAKTTFLEDPLRVLRAIRFGARFGFTLDEEVKEVASSEEVRLALERKICRERIGNEINSMICGNRPVTAITYLHDFKLFGVVFALPCSSEPVPSSDEKSVRYLEAMWNLIQTLGIGNFSCEQKRLALYSALFLPFRKTVYKDGNGKLIPVVDYTFKVSMKRRSKDAETVINIHRAAERFLSLIHPLQLKNIVQYDKLDMDSDVLEQWESISLKDPKVPEISKIRVVTGFLLRDIKDLWRVALVTSLLLYNDDEDCMNLDSQLDKKREVYITVQETIRELGLDTIWNAKPLMNGKEIIEEVQNRGGPVIENKNRGHIISECQRKLLTWQLVYPKGSLEECINWIRQTNSK